jgi:hypothetical protein
MSSIVYYMKSSKMPFGFETRSQSSSARALVATGHGAREQLVENRPCSTTRRHTCTAACTSPKLRQSYVDHIEVRLFPVLREGRWSSAAYVRFQHRRMCRLHAD